MDELETATIIEGEASATMADAAKKPKPRGTPKWEIEARDRLKAAIRRYSKPLADRGRVDHLDQRGGVAGLPHHWRAPGCHRSSP
jgi:hypothetical protein